MSAITPLVDGIGAGSTRTRVTELLTHVQGAIERSFAFATANQVFIAGAAFDR